MATFDEISQYINDYKDPQNLGPRALNAITMDLYKSNPNTCESLLLELYTEATYKLEKPLRVAIVYKWLELNDFRSENSLIALKLSSILDLLSHNTNIELKNKVFNSWIQTNPISNMIYAIELISEWLHKRQKFLSKQNKITSKISRLYLPDDETQLRLITTYILPNLKEIKTDKHKLYQHINNIICKLDLKKIPELEAVKLFSLSPHLNENTITKLSYYYMPDNYVDVLATAEALGVVDNPDYWVQNLPSVISQLNKSKIITDLPELN